MLLCKLSLRYSAHLLPPWPSQTPNIWSFGHFSFGTLGVFIEGCITFKMIDILSSLAFLTVPTLVFAANDFTEPNALELTLLVWKNGRVLYGQFFNRSLATVDLTFSEAFYASVPVALVFTFSTLGIINGFINTGNVDFCQKLLVELDAFIVGCVKPAVGGSEDDLEFLPSRLETEWCPVLLWPGTTELLLTKLAEP